MEDTRRAGPTEMPGWAVRMNEAIELLLTLLLTGIMWLALTLLGLVVLGIGPASSAAADVQLALRDGERPRVVSRMWSTWREELVRGNLRMLPLLLVQAGAGSMLWTVSAGLSDGPLALLATGVLAAVSGAWATVSLAVIVAAPRVRRQDLLVTWRLALLLPGAMPLRSIGLLLLLLVWAVVCSLVWPLALLLGASVSALLAVSVLSRRIRVLLEDLDRGAAARAVPGADQAASQSAAPGATPAREG
ncbi:DUF624 domain-containing protein [Brachybacterium sp. J144]|uniref:DUF624 domain-containing protein n=1 Tax=Brachybacterium sp. J144 TaxID=3116487 RepID=UPI002E7653AD|nr:DUF624 domain-containing protein [Brachybacterium sp. J144]MEE1649442.1 DUF624 domain-containing protein [Brachybacterium sp. J144]